MEKEKDAGILHPCFPVLFSFLCVKGCFQQLLKSCLFL